MRRAVVPVQLALLLILSVSSGAGAREPDQQAATFASRVEAVRVDVLVTDRNGPVLNLDPDDFEVRDNGVRQQVTLVSFEEVPLSVMLALDLSASVDGPRLAHLRKAGGALLAGLEPDDHAGLITFNHLVSRPQPPTPDVGLVRAALDRTEPSGATSLIDATYAGLATAGSDIRRALLVVFSDGTDTSSWLLPDQVVDAARRSSVVVYGVAAGQTRRGPRFLQDVTDVTGGSLFPVDTTENLDAVFVRLLSEFRQRYLLSYTPTGVDEPGWHDLDVRVRRRGVTVKARAGYAR